MTARWKYLALAVTVVVVVLAMAGVASAGSTGEDAVAAGTGSGTASGGEGAGQAVTAATLSPHVAHHLVTLREEEKLARDVYTVLYETWGEEVFNRIAAAESRHMTAVKRLLDKYGLEDPVGDNSPGVFANEKIQAAYTDLVAKGMVSLDDAYKVGIAIEKADIALLRDLIGDTVRRDIKLVAQNLLSGSLNHLAAFTKLLAD